MDDNSRTQLLAALRKEHEEIQRAILLIEGLGSTEGMKAVRKNNVICMMPRLQTPDYPSGQPDGAFSECRKSMGSISQVLRMR